MNRIREIREAKGISLQELAKRVNLMPFWLQRIEQYQWDKSPYGLDFDLKLAEALGVHTSGHAANMRKPRKAFLKALAVLKSGKGFKNRGGVTNDPKITHF